MAKFDFWFNDNGDTAFRKALVFFSEDTDVNKLKKELIEIYGPGRSEPYRYSVYGDNSDQKMSDLEASAEGERGWDAVEGNPFQDALEDPDYMTHHWVMENCSSVIPEEVVERLKSAENENMPQDDDAFIEMLDQMPWVVMTMSNRNPAATFYDVTDTDNELYRLYTNNYMTFSAELLADHLYPAR